MSSRKPRPPSPEENKIINTHLAGILEDLNKAGIYCDGVLAFVTLEGSAYNLSTMMGTEIAEDVETASEALIQYAHDELCDHLDRKGGKHGHVEAHSVTESMGWRDRLETIRKLPRAGAETMMISVRLLDDVLSALDHIDKLEGKGSLPN